MCRLGEQVAYGKQLDKSGFGISDYAQRLRLGIKAKFRSEFGHKRPEVKGKLISVWGSEPGIRIVGKMVKN